MAVAVSWRMTVAVACDLVGLVARLLADAGKLHQAGQVDLDSFLQALDLLELLEIGRQGVGC